MTEPFCFQSNSKLKLCRFFKDLKCILWSRSFFLFTGENEKIKLTTPAYFWSFVESDYYKIIFFPCSSLLLLWRRGQPPTQHGTSPSLFVWRRKNNVSVLFWKVQPPRALCSAKTVLVWERRPFVCLVGALRVVTVMEIQFGAWKKLDCTEQWKELSNYDIKLYFVSWKRRRCPVKTVAVCVLILVLSF